MDTGRQPGDDTEPEIIRAYRQYFEHKHDPDVVAARATIREVAERYREHRETKEDFAAAKAAYATLRARLPAAYYHFNDAATMRRQGYSREVRGIQGGHHDASQCGAVTRRDRAGVSALS